MLGGIKKIILWDYERGTWQYDALCALIIAAVFLIPGNFFGDRDRPMKNSNRYPQANASLSGASNAPNPGKDSGQDSDNVLIINTSEIHEYLQAQGKAAILESNPREALTIFLREKLKREEALDRFVKLDRSLQLADAYQVWLR